MNAQPSTFSYMASALAGAAPQPRPAAEQDAPARDPSTTRTQAMLDLLAQGRQTADSLARAAGVPSSNVNPLLKNHLQRGFVRREIVARRAWYVLTDKHLMQLVEKLQAAKALLVLHGYTVVDPANPVRQQ